MPLKYPRDIVYAEFRDGGGLLAAAQLGNRGKPGQSVKGCPLEPEESEEKPPPLCALTRLVAKGGPRTSTSHLFPADRDHAAIPADDGSRVWLACGHQTITFEWDIDQVALATGGTLEIYARKRSTPAFRVSLDPGELAAGSFEYDGAVGGGQGRLFPSGFLNVIRGPYKARLEITGPVKPDHELAFTYFDVVIDGIELTWGDYAELPRAREDIVPANRPTILGDPNAHPPAIGEEQHTFDALVAAEAVPRAGAQHQVLLLSDLYAKKQPGELGVAEATDLTDFGLYRDLWGDGPRVPIRAKVWVRTADGGRTDQAPAALGGADLLWDWVDRSPDRWQQNLTPTAKTEDFLDALFRQANAIEPVDSGNCPQARGGKLGDATRPIFLHHDGSGEIKSRGRAATGRTWATLGSFPTDGDNAEKHTCTIIFQPSRIAGDRYRVVCSLLFSELQKETTDHAVPDTAKAEAGVFETMRKLHVRYLVRGGAPDLGCDPANIQATIETTYRDEAKAVLEIDQQPIDNNVYRACIPEAIDIVARDPIVYNRFDCFPILAPAVTEPAPAANSPAVVMRGKDAVKAALEATFQAGRLRVVQVAGMRPGERITGNTSGVTAQLCVTTGANTAADRDYLALLQPNTALTDGEDVTGEASGQVARLRLRNAPSVWGTQYVENTSADDAFSRRIDVDFGGGAVHVDFARTGFRREAVTTISNKYRTRLRNALVAAAAGINDAAEANPLTITLTYKQNVSANRDERIANVKETIKELMGLDGPVLDRLAAWERLRDQDWSIFRYDDMYRQIFSVLFADTFMIEALIRRYIERQHPNDRGAFLAHLPGRNNSWALPEHAARFRELRVSGVSYGTSFPADRTRTITFVATVEPNNITAGGGQMFAGDTKSIESIFAHELGHSLFLPHAPINTPGSPDPDNVVEGSHVRGDNCLMNYDLDSEHFCGQCMIRMRGWRWDPAENALGEQEYQVTLELDEIDTLFAEPATTPGGRRERLQTLGLLSRPLDHPEINACTTYSWTHAQRLFPNLNGPSANAIALALNAHVRSFLVQGGALPQPGDFAKIRLPSVGLMSYSQNYLEASVPEADQGQPAAAPYERFMLGADRFGAEQAYFDANPALGKIPLKVTVKRRPRGSATHWAVCEEAREVKVYFELIPANDPAGAPPGPNPYEDVAGGRCYYTEMAAPDLPGPVHAYLDQRVSQHMPSPGAPDADNVHASHGGRRGQSVFLKPRAAGAFEEIPYGDGELAYTSMVVADAHGVARAVFAPSRIGGDRYRLRVFVGPNTQDKSRADRDNGGDDVVTTGTMVRWRTARLCHYLTMPPAADDTEVEANIGKKADGSLMPRMAGQLGDLARLDVSGLLSRSLAQAYTQLIVEPPARHRRSVSLHAAEIHAAAADLLQRFPKFGSTRAAELGITREPMAEVPGSGMRRFSVTLPTPPEPDTVTIRPRGGGYDQRIAEEVGGAVQNVGRGVEDIQAVAINHGAGTVAVTFQIPQAHGRDYDVCYHPASMVDVPQLLEFPVQSPSLFNLALPRVYDARKGGAFLPASVGPDEEARPGPFFDFLDARKLGLIKGLLMEAYVRGIDDNRGFLPGIALFHGRTLDNYTIIWPSGTQEGKAVGPGVFILDDGIADPARLERLSVHELGHAFFLMHAPPTAGARATEHDPAVTCIMSYDPNPVGYCGQCIAYLRGINTKAAPFR